MENFNEITLGGNITRNFTFSHTYYDIDFYMTEIEVKRKSGTSDFIKLIVPENLIDLDKIYVSKNVTVKGSIRNKIDKNSHFNIFVFVNSIKLNDTEVYCNQFHMKGCPVNKSIYRETPKKRHITNSLFAINKSYGRTDYLPLISWGKNASIAKKFEIGESIELNGRLQSRMYLKNDTVHVVNEVSVSEFVI